MRDLTRSFRFWFLSIMLLLLIRYKSIYIKRDSPLIFTFYERGEVYALCRSSWFQHSHAAGTVMAYHQPSLYSGRFERETKMGKAIFPTGR
jgi:hypothetical protein